ncbi:MAG: hypothetical protein U1A78_38705 [Polyangia bacterium]
MRSALSAILFGTALLSACGSSDIVDAGSGTGTLRIDAEISASESVSNALTESQFRTEVSVRITRMGVGVPGASVVIGAAGAPLTLSPANNNGDYRGSLPGYARRYSLDVDAGADNVHGVRLDGPVFHIISAPMQGTLQRAGQPLTVSWSPGGASAATVEAAEMPETATPDNGVFTVAGSFLVADVGKLKDARVRVRRTNTTVLAGGAAGSTLTVRIRNAVDFSIDGR